jgi:hypothetical protein
MQSLKVTLINAIQEDDTRVVKATLALGVDLTQTDDYAPLAVAAMHCSKKIFFMLLLAGADLFAYTPRRNNSPLSPIGWLITGERKDILRILFDLGYLSVDKHYNHIERALNEEKENIGRVMRTFFINRGFQGYSFMPAYACTVYNYEDEPMACEDVSVFLPYVEKKKKVQVRSPRIPRRSSRLSARSK